MSRYDGAYEDVLLPFLDGMRFKLHNNRHKKRAWESNTVEGLLQKIVEETEELRDAIRGGNTIEIMMESYDIANYACMVGCLAVRAILAGKSSDVRLSAKRKSVKFK